MPKGGNQLSRTLEKRVLEQQVGEEIKAKSFQVAGSSLNRRS
jgi:hypothetical protein